MSSEILHEAPELLSDDTKNMHRAIASLREELDAVDWYQQRADACTDDELRAVLVHNKNEEIEHAMMVLEWIRRHSNVLDTNAKTYLYSSGPITAVERRTTGGAEGLGGGDEARAEGSQSLGIGSLKAGA